MEFGILATILGISMPAITFTIWLSTLGYRATVCEKRIEKLEKQAEETEDKYADLQKQIAELRTEIRTELKAIRKEISEEGKHVRELLDFLKNDFLKGDKK